MGLVAQIVDIDIQTVIETVGNRGTDVQTVLLLKGLNLEPRISYGPYVCTINPNGLYNGLYAVIDGLYHKMYTVCMR